jgi:hypothetical protein
MKKIYLFVFLCISSFAFAQAPLLVEDFDYTVGDNLVTKGWASHSGTSNPILVTSPGLTFSGYVGSNIGFSAGVNNTGYDLNKSFGAQTTGTIYTSFLVNATASITAGIYFFHYFDPNATLNHRAKTFISSSTETGKMIVGLTFNSTTPTNMTTTLNFGQTYLFVAKYEIFEGELNDKVSLYVFAAGDDFSTEPTTPTIGPLTATLAGTPAVLAPDIAPTGIALRQHDAAQRFTVDGFRVKTSWQLALDLTTNISPKMNEQANLFYPNPVTNGFLNLISASESVKNIAIYDFVGKKVLESTSISNKVDVSNLKAGIYLLKVTAENQTTSSKLVIK